MSETKVAKVRSFIRTLVDGHGKRLQFLAIEAKTGFSCYILHQEVGADKKVKSIARGGTETLPDYDTAKAWVEKGVAAGLKAGWKAPEGPKGYVAKPDSFGLSNLPKPAKK